MDFFRSSNPALTDKAFSGYGSFAGSETMTYKGTMNKTLLMLALVVLGAAFTWRMFFESLNPSSVYVWMLVGGIGGFITSLVVIFAPKTSPYSAPIYAVLEGLFLGGISAYFAATYSAGIVIQAVGLTFATFFLMLLAFRTGAIKATERFKTGVLAATGAIALMYFVSFILGFFGINIGFIHSSGTFGIIFSLIVVAVAALNLILDFDFIEKASAARTPKYMEWYGAFGLMVTLIWLYIEFLKLLSKISRR
ncbi:MAG TPA: Bax inhibitor-1/YccA family protein [Tenuifilaceae bacterium]|nr:Bax inhibitor-1/YccA family protein [Tenuifilaceae bacterium]